MYIKVLLRNTEFTAIFTLKFHLEMMIQGNDWKTFKRKTATIKKVSHVPGILASAL